MYINNVTQFFNQTAPFMVLNGVAVLLLVLLLLLLLLLSVRTDEV